jgi:hypothetical protein
MVLDSFQGPTTENVMAQLWHEKFNLAVIPGGMTGMLQPQNIVINRPFKAHIWHSYNEWVQKTRKMPPTDCLSSAMFMDMC